MKTVRLLTAYLALLSAVCCSNGCEPKMETPEGEPFHQCTSGYLFGISDTVPVSWDEPIIAGFEYWNNKVDYNFLYIGVVSWRRDDLESGGIILVTHEDGDNPFASVSFNKTGCIIKAAIILTPVCRSLTPSKLQDVVEHEVGHTLGFAHAPGTMNSSLSIR